MANVSVSPETFELVNFDAAEITGIAESVAGAVGLGADVAVTIAVDETAMQGKSSSRVEDGGVVIEASGGAFESLRKARDFDEERCRSVLGHALLRARDRLDATFGTPPADGDLGVREEVAWAAYIEGRLQRLGIVQGRPQRRIYHFRVRHGFSDTVDRVFQELWDAEGLTWADIEAQSAEAAGSAVPA
ncbi:MAG TPA: hypothetical protein VM143_07265 [Acidimicrobiales bacterium]|nr:hypothetical protein [Acidimicrobiales bacterium]